jgi:NADPH:quinone reductase-like Zn-dependent oxidoreductase
MNSIIIENAEGQVSFSSNTPVPEMVEGLHCVKVEMAPINQADLLQMCSKKDPPTTFPSVPGYEGVGHVVGG